MTGSQQACSATARDVFFAVTGTKSQSNRISLGLFQRLCALDSFKRDTHDDMIIETDKHLGDIQVVGVGLDYDVIAKVEAGLLDCHWYVNYISIIDFQNNETEIQFPCYHWLGYNNKEVTATSKVGKQLTYICSCIHYTDGTYVCITWEDQRDQEYIHIQLLYYISNK